MQFIINRASWRAGLGAPAGSSCGHGFTRLLNEEGFMCCLGQVSLQLGASQEEIYNYQTPAGAHVGSDILSLCGNGKCQNTGLSIQAMNINDDVGTTLEEKENKLINLFKEYGHELRFANDYTNPDTD